MGYIGKKPAQVDVSLDSNSITAVEMAGNSVLASEIAANAIGSSELANNSIQALHVPNATALTLDGGLTIDNITIDGTEIDLSSGDLTIDVAGDIELNADGGDINFKDGSDFIGKFKNSSNNFVVKSVYSDADLLIQGNDGGSDVTALTFDMSDAGSAYFNNKVGIGEASPGPELHVTDSDSSTDLTDANNIASFERSGNARVVIATGTGNTGSVEFGDSGGARQGRVSYAHSDDSLGFFTAGSERMNLNSNGFSLKTDTARILIEEADGTNIAWLGDHTGSGHGAMLLYNHGGTATVKLTADSHANYINNGNSLGIGTASPTHTLDVAGDAQISKAGNGNDPILHVIDTADTEVAWFEGNRAGDTGAFIAVRHNPSSQAESNRSGIKFQADDDGGNVTNYARITQYIEDNTNTTEDARLGINVISDGSDNEVVNIRKDQFIYKGDDGSSFIRVDNRADGHDTGFEIYQNGSRKWEIHSDDSNSDALDIRNNAGTTKFTFTQNGELGISNTVGSFHSSVLPLIVGSGSGDEGMAIYSGSSSKGKIGFADSASDDSGSYRGYLQYDHNGDHLNIGTAGSERMRIDSSGDIFFGAQSLTDNGGASISPEEDDGAPVLRFRRAHTTNTSDVIRFINAGSTVGFISHTNSSTAYNTSSDYRLKENVDYTWDATTRLKQLKPARFNWIADDTNTLIDGFLAHEVSSIVPEAVNGEKDAVDDEGNPEYQGIDQSKLVPLLVKTIQELEARITALEE